MKSILGNLVYAACFGLTLAAGGAAAQGSAASFPDKPIRLIVPFSSGGPADAIGRAAAQAGLMAWRGLLRPRLPSRQESFAALVFLRCRGGH